MERAKQVTTSELHAIIGVRKILARLLGVYDMVMVVTIECVCVHTRAYTLAEVYYSIEIR